MNVYFRNSKGERRLLKKNVRTKESAIKIMQDFMDDHNFKSYYTRIWYDKDDGYTWFDVGSHSEFFLVDKDLMREYEDEQKEEKACADNEKERRKAIYYRPE